MDITPRKISPDDMKVIYSSAKTPKFNPGRRAEIKYRDIGITDATQGDMRGEIMHIEGDGIARPTGWHYHTADIQILVMIQGWVKIEFEELGVVTIEEGDSITIPGGTVHQELSSSGPMRLLEITVPAKIGTVNVETPAWAREKADHYGEISQVQQVGHAAE